MSQDALELQFRELRDQILNANREIEELKKSPRLRLRIKDCFIYLCQVFHLSKQVYSPTFIKSVEPNNLSLNSIIFLSFKS